MTDRIKQCNKVDARVECLSCGYPYSESMFGDSDPPLECDASPEEIDTHIKKENEKYVT